MDVSEFLKGRIVVVGVSRNPEKYGYKIFKHLLDKGYDVIPVNPNVDEVDGMKCYKDLDESVKEGKIDGVIIVTKPNVSKKIMEKCVSLGIRKIWLQPGSEPENNFPNLDVVSGLCIVVDGLGEKL